MWRRCHFQLLPVKQQLISSGLAVADFFHHYPKQITAAIAVALFTGAGGAVAVASLAPVVPDEPLRLVTESIDARTRLQAQLAGLALDGLTLYRTEAVRSTDTPEGLLRRLGVADPAASGYLRHKQVAWQAIFGADSAGRAVTAEVDGQRQLVRLRVHWLDADDEMQAQELVVQREGESFATDVHAVPVKIVHRLASGVIRTSLLAATQESGVPGSVARQLMGIFKTQINFNRDLRKGDQFSVVYESLQVNGRQLGTGRLLSAKMDNRGKTYQAFWFQEGEGSGSYYSFDGHSLSKTYFANPLPSMRMTSPFGMRKHPVTGAMRGHAGADFAAPRGTPVHVVSDGVVKFAGRQNGYGNVVYVKHQDGRYTTVYGHLSRIDVKVGQTVKQNQKVGTVGSTGIATGPHLHFEYRDNGGTPRDPVVMLAEHQEGVAISDAERQAFEDWSASMEQQLALAGQVSRSSFE